ncbi:MAG: ParB/RepB/Spo0J family partition protein [Candidatus Omnitrophota bacterium]|jgi:ParB family chromosome partitioning protein
MIEKRALGRGLSALIPEKEEREDIAASVSGETVRQISLSKIRTNKYQPRLDFNEEKLKDLINSIKEKGVVQPILVRQDANGYEVIAGERRLRAVKALGLETIPAIVKDVSDIDMLEIALIENIQRAELNPIEEAHAFHKFISDFDFTQEKISQVLGKDRSTIANTLRLLALPEKIREYIAKNTITAGHAKALLSLTEESTQLRICSMIIEKEMSVRETENLINRKMGAGRKRAENKKDPEIADLESRIQQALGTRVKISHGKKRGKIQIEYYSDNDLNRISDILLSKKT